MMIEIEELRRQVASLQEVPEGSIFRVNQNGRAVTLSSVMARIILADHPDWSTQMIAEASEQSRENIAKLRASFAGQVGRSVPLPSFDTPEKKKVRLFIKSFFEVYTLYGFKGTGQAFTLTTKERFDVDQIFTPLGLSVHTIEEDPDTYYASIVAGLDTLYGDLFKRTDELISHNKLTWDLTWVDTMDYINTSEKWEAILKMIVHTTKGGVFVLTLDMRQLPPFSSQKEFVKGIDAYLDNVKEIDYTNHTTPMRVIVGVKK